MHRLSLGLFIIFSFCIQFLSAQDQSENMIYRHVQEIQSEFSTDAKQVFLKNSTHSLKQSDQAYISKAELFTLKESTLEQIKSERPQTLFLEIPFEGNTLYAQLYQKDVTTPSYRAKAASGIKVSQSKSIFYRGILKGNSNSLVSLSLTNSGLRMTVSDGQGNIEINKIDQDLYAAYRVSDSKHNQDTNCSTTEDAMFQNIDIPGEMKGSSIGDCIEVYIECDFDSYSKNGSSIQNTEDWALALMNEVTILYENVGVPMAVSDILVYDFPDPYLAGGSAGEMLGMMGSVIGNNYDGRLAHVFSTRGVGGGVAYVNVLCAFNNGGSFGPYAVSGSMNTSTIPFPIYSWNVMVIAHELGHNVGSLHTHNCVWNGNNTQIDDCGNQATNQGNSAACYDSNNPIIPPAGTIMSYCHLIGGVGIDFNIGFHSQVGDLLLSRYLNASCVTGEECAGGEPPFADFSYTQSELCDPTEVQFTDQSINATSYLWLFPGGNPSSSTEQNPLVVYSEPGTFDVSLTVFNFAGEDVKYQSQAIVVLETPNLAFDATIENDTMKFNNQTTGSVISYFWDFGDANTSTEVNPCHAYDEDGSYPVTLEVLSVCGDFEIEQYVDFFTPPNAGFQADTTQGCAPTTVNFTNQSTENAEDFTWVFEGGVPETSTEENPQVMYDSAGIYSVTLIVSNDIGEDSLMIAEYITIKETPSAGFTYEADSLEILFTNTSESFDSLTWDFGDGNTSTTMNPMHTYETEGIYDVTLTVSNICDTVTMVQTLELSSLPTADYSATGTTGCLPLSVVFTNTSTLNVDSLIWSFPGGTPSMSTEENPMVVYNEEGVFDVTLIVSNSSGSDTLEETSFITVSDKPQTAFNYSVSDLEVEFMDASSNYDSLLWDFGDGDISEEPNPLHMYGQDGSYEVTLITSNECGSDTSIQTISVSSLPTAGFSSDIQEDCIPLVVTFSNNSSSNANAFDWSFPGGTPSTSTDENPIITYESMGIFDVTLIASSAAGKDTLEMVEYITTLDVPTTDFEYVPLSEFEYSFTNASLYADTYVWDFGDGNTSDLENPTHTFEEPGTYTVILMATNICGEESHEIEIAISDPTSTNEHVIFEGLKVFPNPNNGVFTLSLNSMKSGSAALKIYNALGQNILNKTLDIKRGSNQSYIEMQNASRGVYLMLLELDGQRTFTKVVLD